MDLRRENDHIITFKVQLNLKLQEKKIHHPYGRDAHPCRCITTGPICGGTLAIVEYILLSSSTYVDDKLCFLCESLDAGVNIFFTNFEPLEPILSALQFQLKYSENIVVYTRSMLGIPRQIS